MKTFRTGETTYWVTFTFLQVLPADCGLARSVEVIEPQLLERRLAWSSSLPGLLEVGRGFFRRPLCRIW